MKKFKILIAIVLSTVMFGCSDDEDSLNEVANGSAPANISALFTITQDNSGLVTITPRGEGAGSYDIYFGDGTVEPAKVFAGNKVTHTYAEGSYNVKVVGMAVNGKTAEYTHTLDVTFVQPENLEVTIEPVSGDSFSINVSATANYEAFFEVWFGEDEAAEPVQFNEGETIMHTYAAIGTYEVKVVAYSGGAATAEFTQNVTITNPLLLPINFESTTLNYAFADFGNASSSVVDNPDATGLNTSARVGQSIKNPGAEVWAGTTITLDQTIDFSALKNFKVKVWSPAAGVIVKFKIENMDNSAINHEVDATTTVANEWEVLSFDFSAVDVSQEYSKVILFFNFGVNGSGDTYYFDDIAQAAGEDVVALPLTFESPTLEYIFNGFGGASGARVANPDMTGVNTSDNVVQLVKAAGSEGWAGVAMPLVAPIDFSVQKKIKMKVWSPQANTPVLLKLEKHQDNTVFMEQTVTTTVTSGWEELTFDYTGAIDSSVNYQMVVVFFNFGVSGDGSSYYYDDIKQSN